MSDLAEDPGPHHLVSLLFELPFTLNELQGTVTVPVPSSYLSPEDATLWSKPQVQITCVNEPGPATDVGGDALVTWARKQRARRLARELKRRSPTEGTIRTLLWATTTCCRLDGEQRHPSDPAARLERVIYAMNRLLHAYQVTFEDEEVTFLSREQLLSPIVEVRHDDGRSKYLVRRPPANTLRHVPRPVAESEMALLTRAIENEALDHPMDQVRLWHVQARRARDVHGDYTQAVVWLQTSAEGLLYAVHRLALIDTGADVAGLIASANRTTFSGLVTSQLPGLLGGNWSTSGAGDVAAYWATLYDARNAVVHRGIRLTRGDAEFAFEGYDRLRSHVDARAIANARQLPRVLFGLLGGVGIKERGLLTPFLRQWADDREEEGWPFWLPKS